MSQFRILYSKLTDVIIITTIICRPELLTADLASSINVKELLGAKSGYDGNISK